jgi:hypothetical protein
MGVVGPVDGDGEDGPEGEGALLAGADIDVAEYHIG